MIGILFFTSGTSSNAFRATFSFSFFAVTFNWVTILPPFVNPFLFITSDTPAMTESFGNSSSSVFFVLSTFYSY
jgi:hypothetical protein